MVSEHANELAKQLRPGRGEQTIITRRVEFDAGHRIPDHASKCRNFHGHRYVLEASVTGPVKEEAGASDNGMVQDFGDLKGIMNRAVADPWDHAFLIYRGDLPGRAALNCLGAEHKHVVLSFVPTVENLVGLAAKLISFELRGVRLQHVRLYETPNCWADWYCGQ